MTPGTLFYAAAIFGAIGTLMTGASILLYVQRQTEVRVRLDSMEQKVDTIWDYLYRGGQVEAINRGLGAMHSPFSIHDSVMDWIEPLKLELQQFRKEHPDMDERQLGLAIEAVFGERINELCIKHGVSHGATLIVAVHAAMSENHA